MLIRLLKGVQLILAGLLPQDFTFNLVRQKLANDEFDGFKSFGLVKVVFDGETGYTLQQNLHVL